MLVCGVAVVGEKLGTYGIEGIISVRDDKSLPIKKKTIPGKVL